MTQKHTPEPWVQQETRIMFDGEIIAIVKPSEFALFDAARIVACVNAMAGIDDPETWVKETNLLRMKAQAVLEQGRENALSGQAEMESCHNEIILLRESLQLAYSQIEKLKEGEILTIEEVKSIFDAGCDANCFYHCTMNGQQKPSCLNEDNIKKTCLNCKFRFLKSNNLNCFDCSLLPINKDIADLKCNWEDKQ